MADQVRHICGISGGKDSSALAVYLRGKVPEMEYFFCDTGAELPETYEYLNPPRSAPRPADRAPERRTGFRPLVRSVPRRPAIPTDALVHQEHEGSSPSKRGLETRRRSPMSRFGPTSPNRKGYISTKPNIKSRFPFIEDGIDRDGVMRILEDAGIGLPSYYEWRTRSGCYFCFYQRKAEWIGLADRHPELFNRAVAIEQKVLQDAGVAGAADFGDQAMRGRNYTWSGGESLPQLRARRDDILQKHRDSLSRAQGSRQNVPLLEALADALDEDDDATPCAVCAL